MDDFVEIPVIYEQQSCITDNEVASSSDSTVSAVSEFPYDPSKECTWRQLTFASAEDCLNFYKSYGKVHGFGVRKGQQHMRHSSGKKIDFLFYMTYECYKLGLKKEKKGKEGVVVKRRQTIRTDCKASIRFRFFQELNGYKITYWNDEHNHILIPARLAHNLPSNRSIAPSQENMIDLLMKSGVPQRAAFETVARSHGGRENVGFLRVDMKNHLNKKREIEMAPGEAIVLQRWFRNQQQMNPGFFYDMQLDSQEAISSIFWADSTMIADYAIFGDFVSFDTTYRTNQYYRPLGIFCGFNHHKATCIFGGALLYDETKETFAWVFDAFLRAMNMKMPVTLMTDQAPAIGAAAKIVLPGVFHGLCCWHLLQNAQKNLTNRATDLFRHEFHHLISYVDTEEEFEFSWNNMMEKCFDGRPMSDFSWLARTYPLKKKWSSAWVKREFTAGKTTTQLSEQLNAFSRFYLKPDHSMSQFFIRFQAMLDDLRHNELTADFHMVNRVPNNMHLKSSIMVQAAKVFTPAIFDIFQEQYDLSLSFTLTVLTDLQRGSTQFYKVERREDEEDENSRILEDHMVEVDLETRRLSCSCHFYDNWWILCRHMMRVMDGISIFQRNLFSNIPEFYIKKRWTKTCKEVSSCKEVSELVGQSKNNSVARYQSLCSVMVAASTRICLNQAAYDFFISKVVDAAKDAELLIPSNMQLPEPLNHEFLSVAGEEDLSNATLKKRKNPITSKDRLKPTMEVKHLKKKQKNKAAMKKASHVQPAQ